MTDDQSHADWIDLTQPFDADVPHSAALPAPSSRRLATSTETGSTPSGSGRRPTSARTSTHLAT